jgi:succinoglycan biosynthesis transport protein ExoP
MTDIAGFEHVHIGEYFALFRREKWRALLVGCAILASTVGIVAVWPSTYRSTATILVEEADIPADLVMSTVTAFASERIQAIQQRIITTANLVGIINKLNLYAEERKSAPTSQIADEMRANIALSIVSADTASKGGRDTRAAIAFTLSFDGDTPQTTQQVTNELATLFLSESQRDRDQRASGTTSFLEAETQRLHADVETLESKLEAFRTRNAGYLPEDRTINQQLLDRTDSQLLDLSRQIQTLRDRQGILRAQLARTDANSPPADRTSLSPADQLALLQAKRAEISARYGPKHPDVLALDRQINAFEGANSVGAIETSALKLQVQNLQAELQIARQKYGPKHPDTLKLEREVNAAQEQLAAAPVPDRSPAATNPDYLQIQVELASVNGELAADIAQQQATEDKKSKIEERLFRGPTVERDYIALKRDYDAAVAKYLDIRSKEAEAQLTRNLETKRMGETLTLLEPPVEPIAPIKPNRRVILAIGFLAAIVGGIATGVLHDAADGRVHGWRQLAAISGQSPFAVVPLIRTDADRRRARQGIMLHFLLGLLLVVAVLFYVNSFVTPLDVLLTDIAERFGLLSTADAPSVAN